MLLFYLILRNTKLFCRYAKYFRYLILPWISGIVCLEHNNFEMFSFLNNCAAQMLNPLPILPLHQCHPFWGEWYAGDSINLMTNALSFFNFILKFIYLFWERERDRDRERIPNQLCTVSTEPSVGLNPWTMRSWLEPRLRVGCLPDRAIWHPMTNALSNTTYVFFIGRD